MRALAGLLLLWATGTHAFCFQAAAERYRLDPLLLESLAIHESHMNPAAINTNRNRAGQVTSTDYGVMQINSQHLPELRRLGLVSSPRELLSDSCLNVQVGAWILARTFRLCGAVSWDCLGAYNAGVRGDIERRRHYSRDIYRIYTQLRKTSR